MMFGRLMIDCVFHELTGSDKGPRSLRATEERIDAARTCANVYTDGLASRFFVRACIEQAFQP